MGEFAIAYEGIITDSGRHHVEWHGERVQREVLGFLICPTRGAGTVAYLLQRVAG
jgi:hypothetical protein